ncbi:MAG: type II toxin-antitoxin system PemK/MazF family toxin [Bifidobacteriaceae bacterium]|nr:type II toxin-antitoxin system PemK/MazF family toxin [Bifidobacteriaceae bacterium]
MRGDVYRLRSNREARGHEQRGVRYAVVVQSDHLLLSTTLVAPTSTSARATSFRPSIVMDGITTLVLADQVTAVDGETRIGEFVGRLSAEELAEVDRALKLVLGLR